MQKKLIALALASLAGSAFAQTNVTIYGIADGTLDFVKSSGPTLDNDKYNQFQRVSANSSYIGFKGVEDLGNGIKAVFQFENSVAFDNTGGTWAARDSFVGLTGGFGTVVLGTLTGPTRALGAAMDVNAGATGIGANSGIIGKTGGGNGLSDWGACGKSSTCTSVFDTRWSNSIAYVSPTFSGFTGVAAYVANENKNNELDAKASLWGYDVGLTYANGPWFAGLSFNEASTGTDTGLDKTNVLRLGGKYDAGNWSVRLMWEKTKMKWNDGYKETQSKWGLGGTFNVTQAGKIIAQYYRANDVNPSDGSWNDSGAKLFEVGYEHSLSKRTMLKATYAQIANDDNANFDFGVNAVGIGANTSGWNGQGAKVSGFQFGVRHSF